MKTILAVVIAAFILASCTKDDQLVKPEVNRTEAETIRTLIQSKCPYVDWSNASYEVDTSVTKPDPKYWNIDHLKTIILVRAGDWNYDPWIPFTGPPSYRGAGTWNTILPGTNSEIVINFTYYSNGQQWREIAEVWELKDGRRYTNVGWRITFSKPLRSY